MKKRILVTLSIVLSSILLMSAILALTIKDISLSSWHKGANGYISAVVEQQKSGKPMAIFFYTDWCSNCERLRNDVLATDEVEQFVGNVIPVQINPELSTAARRIAADYDVVGYPTIVLVPAAKEKTLQRIATNHRTTPASFIQSCQQALRKIL